MSQLSEMLLRHEGFMARPYRCTEGKLTVGIGRNLDEVGLSKPEALFLLDNDIIRLRKFLSKFPWFNDLNPARQDALIDMAFMGEGNFQEFHLMLRALENGRYEVAAMQMLASKWATQVGKRSTELAQMMREGRYVYPRAV